MSLEREVEWLGGGYGRGAVAKRPLWWKEGEYLLFSDIAPDTGLSPTLFQDGPTFKEVCFIWEIPVKFRIMA